MFKFIKGLFVNEPEAPALGSIDLAATAVDCVLWTDGTRYAQDFLPQFGLPPVERPGGFNTVNATGAKGMPTSTCGFGKAAGAKASAQPMIVMV